MLRKPLPSWIAWCLPVVLLAAVGLGLWIVRARPLSLFGAVLVGLACVPAGWVLVSALFPAKAERRCPACGADALVRLDARSTQGLRCRACDWCDPSASAWLLAEEEGPLEDIVLAQRGRAPRPRTLERTVERAVDRAVDSSGRRG